MMAFDLDSDLNSIIYYNITEGNDIDIFAVDSASGLLTLGKTQVASAAQEIFSLTVEALDENDQSKKDTATVLVNLFPPDGPPHYPAPSLNINIKEGLVAGNKIVSAAAASTEHVVYEILSGNEDRVIEIDKFSGDLVTARELDHEKSPRYIVHVLARDSKDRTADVSVTINVEDINDNTPYFIDSVGGQVEQKVDGHFHEGDEVTQIEAYDLDHESSMQYKLSPEAEAFFSVDNQGFIHAKRTIEGSIPGKRATDPLSTLSFNVEAKDNADPPNSVSTPVRLAFASYNSDQSALTVKVTENAQVGRMITEVPRYIPGGKMSILYPEKSSFTLDDEARLTLGKELDFETQAKYVLTVREQGMTDRGHLTNDIDLEISAEDVNDNDPKIISKTKHGRVNSNARAGAKVLSLQVFDADFGPNGLAGYQLATGDTPFGINPLDETIEVDGRLKKNQYELEIYPFDFGIPQRQSPPINVRLDIGQMPPRFLYFYDDGYKFEVPEDAKGGTVIGKVTAVSASGARIGYSILEGNSDNKFKISENGHIKLNFLLDYETQPKEYTLVVQAIESIPEGFASTVKVAISVLNTNDYYPVFERGFYQATVSEDASMGASIVTLSATDCDCSQDCSCKPGQLSFVVIDDSYFTVDSDTGIISNARSLDFENNKFHIFQVEVSDTLLNKVKYDVAFVNITVTNANDNQPHFSFPEYRLTIDEEAAIGNGLGAVLAHDLDHHPITYSIIAGTSPFQIDSQTGVISLRNSLPNQPWEYTLTIRASDSETYSDAKTIIYIRDKNNNRPVFEKCENAELYENTPARQIVTQVLATDNDRGINGEVEYSIVYGDPLFEIDNATGVIRSTEIFDREFISDYVVVIKAEDGGHGQSSSNRLLR